MAVAAFRALLRQIHSTFHGDVVAIRHATKEASTRFKANKNLTSTKAIQQHIADAEEARMFMRDSIVQAQKSSCGSYAVKPADAGKLQGMTPDAAKPRG